MLALMKLMMMMIILIMRMIDDNDDAGDDHDIIGTSEIQKFGNSEIQIFSNSEIRKIENSKVRKFENSEIRKFGSSEVRKFRTSEIRKFRNSEARKFGNAKGWKCRFRKFGLLVMTSVNMMTHPRCRKTQQAAKNAWRGTRWDSRNRLLVFGLSAGGTHSQALWGGRSKHAVWLQSDCSPEQSPRGGVTLQPFEGVGTNRRNGCRVTALQRCPRKEQFRCSQSTFQHIPWSGLTLQPFEGVGADRPFG